MAMFFVGSTSVGRTLKDLTLRPSTTPYEHILDINTLKT